MFGSAHVQTALESALNTAEEKDTPGSVSAIIATQRMKRPNNGKLFWNNDNKRLNKYIQSSIPSKGVRGSYISRFTILP